MIQIAVIMIMDSCDHGGIMKRLLAAVLACLICAASWPALAEGIVLPAGLLRIEEEAFFGLQSAHRAELPDGLEYIGARAFAYSSITSVTLPDSLEYIAEDAFEGCGSDMTVTASLESYAGIWAMQHGLKVAGIPDQVVRITGSSVYVRTQPDTNGTILGSVNRGTRLVWLGQISSENWYKVSYKGEEGWVSGKYSVLTGDAEDETNAIVDISKWQGAIDFDELKGHVSLVIVRAGCGTDRDSRFASYAASLNARGIPFGVYWYSKAASVAQAQAEAEMLYSVSSPYGPKFYVMDAETTSLDADMIGAFADRLRLCGASKTGCYVAQHLYRTYGYASVRDRFDFTWIPGYGKNDGTITGSVKPPYTCDLWQYTSAGRLPGIDTSCDLNVITGDGRSLSWFLD